MGFHNLFTREADKKMMDDDGSTNAGEGGGDHDNHDTYDDNYDDHQNWRGYDGDRVCLPTAPPQRRHAPPLHRVSDEPRTKEKNAQTSMRQPG